MPTSSQSHPILSILIIILTLQLHIQTANSQQEYIQMLQLNCNNDDDNNNDTRTLGFVCNGAQPTCTSYLTFRSTPPRYSTARAIAALLGANGSDTARLNGVSETEPLGPGRMIMVPMTCTCTGRYYQHNATYTLKDAGDTYFTMANTTYQGLTTCQAMMAQNTFTAQNLKVGYNFLAPLRCACPTAGQEARYGARFLAYYVVGQGDDVSHIAKLFGVDPQSIWDANDLTPDSTIYTFSPILVPLKSVPTYVNFSSISSPPSSPSLPHIPSKTGGNSSKKRVLVGVGFGVGILVLISSSPVIIIIIIIIIRFSSFGPEQNPASTVSKRAKNDPESTQNETVRISEHNMSTTTRNPGSLNGLLDTAIGSLTVYTFTQLQTATANFSVSNIVKGSLFEAHFDGDKAAVKILKGRVAIACHEINTLKQLNHSNIIRLSGYCIHQGDAFLVYKFAERRSLDIYLFDNDNNNNKLPVQNNPLSPTHLGWKQRVKIACNVANGLNYLHNHINPPYIHNNLRSSNIVLDANFEAKITNFALSKTTENAHEEGRLRLTQHVVGTHGYLAPEYLENGLTTLKLDVFAFGVVLLELLSGKMAVFVSKGKRRADNLLSKVIKKVFEGENVREGVVGFMDDKLGGEYSLESAFLVAQLGCRCVDEDMNVRPSMDEVSMILSKIYSSLEHGN